MFFSFKRERKAERRGFPCTVARLEESHHVGTRLATTATTTAVKSTTFIGTTQPHDTHLDPTSNEDNYESDHDGIDLSHIFSNSSTVEPPSTTTPLSSSLLLRNIPSPSLPFTSNFTNKHNQHHHQPALHPELVSTAYITDPTLIDCPSSPINTTDGVLTTSNMIYPVDQGPDKITIDPMLMQVLWPGWASDLPDPDLMDHL